MNLSNFSLLLTAGLLALTAYLSLQSRQDTNARLNKISTDLENAKKASDGEWIDMSEDLAAINEENIRLAAKNQEIMAANGTKGAELKVLSNEGDIVSGGASKVVENAKPPKPEVELTPQEEKIMYAKSVAAVTDYVPEHAFVGLDKGSPAGIEPGMQFLVRRDQYIIGRIEISTVEGESSIGNVDPSSIPVGMTIRKGDTIILLDDAGIE